MAWQDPVLCLVQDPQLFTSPEQSLTLSEMIGGLAERRISKLCSQAVVLLKSLETIGASFRTWEFMSLDFNSDQHFSEANPLHSFNEGLAERVMDTCKSHQEKLHYIAVDIDNLTKVSKTLTPMEYISDSGTLLTSLVLRTIRTKADIYEKTTIAYSKAKLILIGKELDEIADADVLAQYRHLLFSLVKQLNEAIDADDAEAKHECLAVISDMEVMFEQYKLEQELEKQKQQAMVAQKQQYQRYQQEFQKQYQDEARRQFQEEAARHARDEEQARQRTREAARREEIARQARAEEEKRERRGTSSPLFNDYVDVGEESEARQFDGLASPLVAHEKSDIAAVPYDPYDVHVPPYTGGPGSTHPTTPQSASVFDDDDYMAPLVHSITKEGPEHLEASASSLYRTSLTEEMPYLMSAFSSARNFEEDVQHYKSGTSEPKPPREQRDSPKRKVNKRASHDRDLGRAPRGLAQSNLYASSTMLKPPSPPASVFTGSAILARLGIKPQVIEVPTDEENKENRALPAGPTRRAIAPAPLTRENLRSLDDLVD
ncbi:hypothetical protein DICA4_C15390 [Diutina catenulata]